MRLNIVSDLHIDQNQNYPTLPGGDILVIVGDTGAARHYAGADIKAFFKTCSRDYSQVVMVMGNHEHYQGDISQTLKSVKANVPPNFHVLENDLVEFDDVVLLGSTLWTDCNARNLTSMSVIQRDITDFRLISNGKAKFTPEDSVQLHEKSLAYFRATLPGLQDKKVIMVTHHSPSAQSIHADFVEEFHLNGAFHSSLESIIRDNQQIKYWLHGHTHYAMNYPIEQCHVLCNPRGYNFEKNHGWDPALSLEV